MEFKKHDRRQLRIEKEVQQSLAQFLLHSLSADDCGVVSVTRVQMPKDLRSARVFVHQYGVAALSTDELLEKLEKKTASAQRHISQDLNLRYCPKLEFLYDKGFEKTLAVDKLIYDMTQAGAFKKSQESPE